MNQTVIGMFDDAQQAREAALKLENVGVTRDHIDISAQSAAGTAHTATPDRDDDTISGFFRSLFNSDDEVSKYSSVARRGAMVTVHADSPQQAERARDILDQCGAVDVDERHQQYQTGWTGMAAGQSPASQSTGMSSQDTSSATPMGATAGAQNLNRQDVTGRGADATDRAIPIIEEHLQVGKREVETGGARIRSRIVEKPVEEHLRLRQEHVWIERNPVNRPASEADIQGFREGQIEMTEHAEVPVVNKEARVVEEIRMGKEVEERDETVRGTVRRTDVDVERLGGDQSQQRRMTSDDDDLNNRSGL